MDRSQFTRTVDNFCDEASSARSQNRSLNLDLRVLGLGTGGSSNARTNSTVTKYCSDESDERRDEVNYQQYLEGIAPGAYAAYQNCTTAARNGVQFEMLTPITRDALEVVVFHRTDTPKAQAEMSWSGIGPVTCQWESFGLDGEVEAPQKLRILQANERTRLKCERDSFNEEPITEPDFVSVIRRDGGDKGINIPWQKYGPDGTPVQTLEEIQRSINAAVNTLRDDLRAAEQRLQGLVDIGTIQILVRTRGQGPFPNWGGGGQPSRPSRAGNRDSIRVGRPCL